MHALECLWGLHWNLRCAAAAIGCVSLCKRMLLFLTFIGLCDLVLSRFSQRLRGHVLDRSGSVCDQRSISCLLRTVSYILNVEVLLRAGPLVIMMP
ncbi:hypothetical protein BJX68DRAFT_225888 [Aspergillus pseudodeflectus]|uniref:Secreted protein n=1 Tax=Aspergillus pseudodeflectus TaxID=176178 RepID=A0ABR4L801_9EURO